MAVVAYDDAELLDIACVTTTLATANDRGADPPYAVRLLTPGGQAVTCRPGLRLDPHEALERRVGEVDTLIVAGGYGHERAAADEVVLAHVLSLIHI